MSETDQCGLIYFFKLTSYIFGHGSSEGCKPVYVLGLPVQIEWPTTTTICSRKSFISSFARSA